MRLLLALEGAPGERKGTTAADDALRLVKVVGLAQPPIGDASLRQLLVTKGCGRSGLAGAACPLRLGSSSGRESPGSLLLLPRARRLMRHCCSSTIPRSWDKIFRSMDIPEDVIPRLLPQPKPRKPSDVQVRVIFWTFDWAQASQGALVRPLLSVFAKRRASSRSRPIFLPSPSGGESV